MEIFEVNGLRILYHKNSSFLTSIQILTDVGSDAESSDIYGMAHILEHMFFKGSKKRPEGTDISRAANDIGGKMNAYTTHDHTAYYITVLNDVFEEGLDILADMYQNPLFRPEEFSKELNPILSEYREREDDPENFIFEKAMEGYMGESYHSIIGTPDTIKAASVDRMHKFKTEYYGGNNTMISIVGGVDRDRAVRAISQMFEPAGKTMKPGLKTVNYTPGEITLSRSGIQEAYYVLLYPALGNFHPERYKQDMMNYILGGNDSSLLFERIREELGMSSYGIYSWVMRHDSFQSLAISGGIAPDELDQLDTEVRGQIDRICESLVDEARLNRARASLKASIAARSETSHGFGSMIGVPVLKGETENPAEKALREIEKVTLEEILESARSTFSGPAFKAVLLPEDD